MRVCVIGAGPSGLSCAKWMKEEGFDVVVYEQTDHLGGVWAYTEDTEAHSSAYKSLKTNTIKNDTQFSDFPMPGDFPPNPNHVQILQYLSSYANHFALNGLIQYCTTVVSVQPLSSSSSVLSKIATIIPLLQNPEHLPGHTGWKVQIKTSDNTIQEEIFDAVAVCNGHHWSPITPNVCGTEVFRGLQIHSHNYRTPDITINARVMVVGMGISGGEIVHDIEPHAKEIIWATRRNLNKSPAMFVNAPCPIHTKPMPKKILEDRVIFVDDTEMQCDLIIWCTGYKYLFPFLDETLMKVEPSPSRVGLYMHVFPSNMSNIAFVGLISTQGSIHPICELQGKWFARILAGRSQLPSIQEMKTKIAQWSSALSKYNVAYRPLEVQKNSYMGQIEDLIISPNANV